MGLAAAVGAAAAITAGVMDAGAATVATRVVVAVAGRAGAGRIVAAVRRAVVPLALVDLVAPGEVAPVAGDAALTATVWWLPRVLPWLSEASRVVAAERVCRLTVAVTPAPPDAA
jgi:hypothetical protein